MVDLSKPGSEAARIAAERYAERRCEERKAMLAAKRKKKVTQTSLATFEGRFTSSTAAKASRGEVCSQGGLGDGRTWKRHDLNDPNKSVDPED